MKRKKTFRNIAEDLKEKNKTFSVFQECLFLYNYIDYLLRYFVQIYPKLRKREIVITDRYFYDIYGQYPYAENSLIVEYLIKMFPKPDQTFILDADIETIMKRGKTKTNIGEYKKKVEEQRKVKSQYYLKGQRRRYKEIENLLEIKIINTEQDAIKVKQEIVGLVWHKIIKRAFE